MICKSIPVLAILVAFCCGACGPSDPAMVRMLLPEGDAAAGKQAFMDLGCPVCHTVTGVEGLPVPAVLEASFELGPTLGGLSRGGLATSMIVPTHVNAQATELWTDWEEGQRVWLGPGQVVTRHEEAQLKGVSRMSNYTTVMTVKQLSDLVAFLESIGE
jgi:hypothetical protein